MSGMRREDIIRAICEAIDRTNESLEPDARIAADEGAVLFGPGGLDSLGLVGLILDVEEAINAASGAQLNLADERAVSRGRNPFRDVRSLADYIQARLAEEGECATAPSS